MVTRWVSQRSTAPTSFVLQFAEGFPPFAAPKSEDYDTAKYKSYHV